jgi:hypothetical protein
MIKRVFRNLYFLAFLNGFLLASLFYFKMEANYERELFRAIHSNISSKISPSDIQDSVLAKVMHACHDLMVNRESVFQGTEFNGIQSNLLEPASFDLMTAKGACGSYSYVLARILQGYKYQVRIAQMKSKGVFAAHNIVEARTMHGWVVLDPLFDMYFVNPLQKLASFEEVKNNWEYYKKQLPAGYDMTDRYEDVRYSNWTKIPIILPAIKKLLNVTIGEKEADTISIRTYFLRKYKICFDVFGIIFIFVFIFTVIRLIKAKVFPHSNIPVTFSNVYKYVRMRILHKNYPEHSQA